jgi:hypothetical protein
MRRDVKLSTLYEEIHACMRRRKKKWRRRRGCETISVFVMRAINQLNSLFFLLFFTRFQLEIVLENFKGEKISKMRGKHFFKCTIRMRKKVIFRFYCQFGK